MLINFRERKFLKVTRFIGHILGMRKFEIGQNLSVFAKCNCTGLKYNVQWSTTRSAKILIALKLPVNI